MVFYSQKHGAKMLEKLKQSSVGALFGLIPPWLLYLLVALALMMAGAKLNGVRWALKYERLQHDYESAQAQAQAVATEKTTANATATAKLDKTYYEEYQNAQKTADYWRARVRTERVSVCAKTANHAETRTTGGVGDDTAADIGADRSMDVSGSAIVDLSESAKQMRAQVNYLQGKVTTDAETINGVSDEK